MSNNNDMACYVCTNCQGEAQTNKEIPCDDLVQYKCNKWLTESALPDDDRSLADTETSESDLLSVSETTEETGSVVSDLSCPNQIININGEIIDTLEDLTINNDSYKNISLRKCNNVYLGQVAKIYGPVQINQTVKNVIKNEKPTEIFLNGDAITVPSKRLNIVNRINWLAQPFMKPPDVLNRPVKLVIISHTATQSALTQADNVLLVRLIQTFHIESRKWDDIGYNFLVGCDGKVYEGRGWGAVGAHTYGYNKKAIGISFIGCFMNVLPNEAALHQTKALIDYGVEIGEIDKDYVLVGHCQCSPTESPGKLLFKEIKTWEHWSDVVPQ